MTDNMRLFEHMNILFGDIFVRGDTMSDDIIALTCRTPHDRTKGIPHSCMIEKMMSEGFKMQSVFVSEELIVYIFCMPKWFGVIKDV